MLRGILGPEHVEETKGREIKQRVGKYFVISATIHIVLY
jgi:hypothetical protein